MNKFLEDNLEKFRDLNNRIKRRQDIVISEVIRLDKQLKQRVLDKNDLLDDYEIEIFVSFHLKEDDNEYIEDEDNILARFYEYEKNISDKNTRIGKNNYYKWNKYNHNEFKGFSFHPMKNDSHCWWFHCLYDHTDLEFDDLLRIGIIWTDIKVWYQFFDENNNSE